MRQLQSGIIVATLLLTQVTSNIVSTYHNTPTKSTRNMFLAAHAACTSELLTVLVKLRHPFTGIIYSRGSPVGCQASGNGSRELWMNMPLDDCGTKVIEENGKRVYENFLYIQYDRQVQQAADEQILVRCSQDIVVTGALGSTHPPQEKKTFPQPRAETLTSGHMHSGGNLVDAWMDIMKGKLPLLKKVGTYVNVGEEITMLIKIRQKPGLEAKVTGCIAHDGVSSLHQRLTDNNGCSVNKKVMGDLVEKVSNRNGMKAVHATLTAFRFPDKNKLFLECQVLICNFTCPPMTCRNNLLSPMKRIKRSTYASILNNRESQILDEIEVINSVEVRKPTDTNQATRKAKSKDNGFLSVLDDSDNFLCLSTTRLLLVGLSILSLVTTLMVITICMCVRSRKLQRRLNRRMGIGFPYGRVIDYT